jgi:putative endonuclease
MSEQDNKLRAPHLKLGQIGEELVVEFLEMTKHEILERNWRSGRAEIDIIARTNDSTLLFIEVKTRSKVDFGLGSQSIGKRKKQLILDAAVVYSELKNHSKDIRFDVANVIIDDKGEVILEYAPDAFFDEF